MSFVYLYLRVCFVAQAMFSRESIYGIYSTAQETLWMKDRAADRERQSGEF